MCFHLQTGKLQKTIASFIEKTGKTLHSGKLTKVKLLPELAGQGRYFDCNSEGVIQASITFAEETPLCTTLCGDGFKIRTVEHLLSALEATGVDNCRIMISDFDDRTAEVGRLGLYFIKFHPFLISTSCYLIELSSTSIESIVALCSLGMLISLIKWSKRVNFLITLRICLSLSL